MAFSIFGYEFKKTSKEKEKDSAVSFAPQTNDDGAITVQAAGAYGYLYNLDYSGTNKTEFDLITKYREISLLAEVESCVDDIVNDAIVQDDSSDVVELDLSNCDIEASVKKAIQEEFRNILSLLNWNNNCYDIFKRWYVDGRLYFHIILAKNEKEEGILQIRYVDPRCIKKVREVENKQDENGVEITVVKDEYFVYSKRGIRTAADATSVAGVKITSDCVVYVHSGLVDQFSSQVLSYLHKAIKPINQLKMMEDAAVIYRIARAPERRIFGIDVGGLQKNKAEDYMKNVIARFKNKMGYDVNTGEISSETNVMSVIEDYWIPKKDGHSNISIDTLPAGENLGEIKDIEYFEKKLYKSLSIPISRMNSETGVAIGRASEISRDELKFMRFVYRLRLRFSHLFDELLQKQLIVKKIIDVNSWEAIKEQIFYKWSTDNYFSELKEAEILKNRLETLDKIGQYRDVFYTDDWIKKNVLRMTEKDLKQFDKDMKKKAKDIEENPELADQQAEDDESINNKNDKKFLPNYIKDERNHEN